jgi:hypothetical protein
VTYQTDHMLEKNRDFVISEHQALMAASSLPVVRALFAAGGGDGDGGGSGGGAEQAAGGGGGGGGGGAAAAPARGRAATSKASNSCR